MSKKQTAVEWLYQRLQTEPYLTLQDFEQAKAIEKDQIIDAYDDGIKAGIGDYIDTVWGKEGKELTSEQYYKETYGGKNE